MNRPTKTEIPDNVPIAFIHHQLKPIMHISKVALTKEAWSPYKNPLWKTSITIIIANAHTDKQPQTTL